MKDEKIFKLMSISNKDNCSLICEVYIKILQEK